jgi:hypothetical protein
MFGESEKERKKLIRHFKLVSKHLGKDWSIWLKIHLDQSVEKALLERVIIL